jgi:hypothetical protein
MSGAECAVLGRNVEAGSVGKDKIDSATGAVAARLRRGLTRAYMSGAGGQG